MAEPVNSKYVNREGYVKCIVCGKKKLVTETDNCPCCERFACKTCGSYYHKAHSWCCFKCQGRA